MASVGIGDHDASGDIGRIKLSIDDEVQKTDEDKGRDMQFSTTREAAEDDEVEQIRSKSTINHLTETSTSNQEKKDEVLLQPQPESVHSTTVDERKPDEVRVSLERKIVKMKSIQKQLVEANSEWEKHCDQLNRQHDEQIKALTKDLQLAKSQSERRLREQQESFSAKQNEWREEMSRLRKDHTRQLDEVHGQLAEREANYQSLLERRPDGHGHKNVMETRVQELERQVKQLTRGQRPGSAPTRNAREGHQQPTPPTRLRADASTSELRTHIAVLQAQVSAFKEDFENERTDKERAESERATLQHRLEAQARSVDDLKRLVEQKERESAAVRNQNEYVRQQYTQKCRELESERTNIAELRAEVSRLKEQPYRGQRPCSTCSRNDPVSRRPAPPSTWKCVQCTFDNPYPRVTCEICGNKASHAMVGHITADRERLLARQMEQSDTTGRKQHRFCFQDVIEDAQYDY